MPQQSYDFSKIQALADDLEYSVNYFADTLGNVSADELTSEMVLDRFLRVQCSYRALQAVVILFKDYAVCPPTSPKKVFLP